MAMKIYLMKPLQLSSLLALATTIVAIPVVGENSNFASLTISPESSLIEVAGNSVGSFSLSTIANKDRQNNWCLGFGNFKDIPDHILVLQQDLSRLQVKVKSKENDTTLLIQGSDNTIRCGGVKIEDSNWKAGEHKVWIGSPDSGIKRNYTLSVQN